MSFWAAHIRDLPTKQGSAGLITEVKGFFQNHFLYWLEVMSVTEQVTAAHIALLVAADWVQVSEVFTGAVACTEKCL